MFDMVWVRHNPDAFDASLVARGAVPLATELLALDADYRSCMTELQLLLQRRNAIADAIAAMPDKQSPACDALKKEAASLKEPIAHAHTATAEREAMLHDRLMRIPNRLHPSVPFGNDASSNLELRRIGEPTSAYALPHLYAHEVIAQRLGMFPSERASAMSGSRFVVLTHQLARLERALAQWMLDVHSRDHGYVEVSVPYLVRPLALEGTGQLPKFTDDLFQTTDGRYLISTAEVSLTNMVRDMILDASVLPKRLTAYTPCFRSEAGAAGRDMHGMIRLHQFSKVELVSVVHPDDGEPELERMTQIAETLLQQLGLPYRVMLLCSGDTGFQSSKTYDIEVWLAGQQRYCEISSCSLCGDFQAIRMQARYRTARDNATQWVYTLNGSALPIGRTMVALLEYYQCADGSVDIPAVLHPYMGGMTRLDPLPS